MNEKAIQDAYKLFQGAGYGKSIDDFRNLMSSNQNALNDAYKLFQGAGYKKSVDEFKVLMGAGASQQEPLKKKNLPYRLPNWLNLLRFLLPKRLNLRLM